MAVSKPKNKEVKLYGIFNQRTSIQPEPGTEISPILIGTQIEENITNTTFLETTAANPPFGPVLLIGGAATKPPLPND